MRVLLDTCTFLWALTGDSRLPPGVAKVFRDPSNDVFLSAASAWEIAQKYALGKLKLPEPPDQFVPSRREARAIASLAVDEESAMHASRLPFLHRDPFDRLLVAQSIIHGMAIATPDPLVRQYLARVIW
jgi:PIN domain nuclease of toxin-antitoxin system